MSVSCSRRRWAVLTIVASLATSLGTASAQAIAHSNATSMLISAAEGSGLHETPALLDRLGITTLQTEQIRTVAAQHRLRRGPLVEQMARMPPGSNSATDQGTRGMFLRRLQDLDRAQEAQIEAILTPDQLRSLRQLAPNGAVVISGTLPVLTPP